MNVNHLPKQLPYFTHRSTQNVFMDYVKDLLHQSPTPRTNYTVMFNGCLKSSYMGLGKNWYCQQCTLKSH